MKLPKPNYRRENITHLFKCVIYSLEIVTKEYDITYTRLKLFSKRKRCRNKLASKMYAKFRPGIDEFTLNERTLKTCKRLLR